MNLQARLFRASSALAVIALAAACGGETLGAPTGPGIDPGVDAGVTPPISGGGIIIAPGGGSGEGSGGSTSQCVDVEVTAEALSCDSDSDCTLIPSGIICADSCQCPGTPVNQAAAAAYSEDIPKWGGPPVACGCPASFTPQCVAGQCVSCGGDVNCGISEDAGPPIIIEDAGPPISFDSGPPTTFDGGQGDDSGFGFDGGQGDDASTGTCVEIDLSTYDQSCNTSSDCFDIQVGEVCDGTCPCFGSPVNISEEARYEQAVSGIAFADCNCPAGPVPQCIDGTCISCGGPSNPCPAIRTR